MLTNGFLHLINQSLTFGEVQNLPVGHINNYAQLYMDIVNNNRQ